MISTEAWVLRRESVDDERAQMVREDFEFPDIEADEVLAMPLYGCWEANMDHALRRSPMDLCALRNEPRIVLGNAGVVEVIETGSAVRTLAPGDRCIVFCNGSPDEYGYPRLILGYDAPNTMGVLAKRIKLRELQLIPIARDSRFSLPQWAAFSLRYVTAWANWRVAHTCWRSQMDRCPSEQADILAWGGGVSLAELTLARLMGHPAAMVASRPSRLALLRNVGISAIDRNIFGKDDFEDGFLTAVHGLTDGRGAAIFVDNIGAHYRTTLKALARQGVITTSGWKHGLTFPVVRAAECIARHIHVYTHYARYEDGQAAVVFAEERGWIPPPASRVYMWNEIPQLAEDYAAGRIDDYFPIFSIN